MKWMFYLLALGLVLGASVVEEPADKNGIHASSEYLSVDADQHNIISLQDTDLDQDGQIDEVRLYFEGGTKEVILQTGSVRTSILKVDSEQQIFDARPSDQYIFQLYAEGNKLLVGWTYAFTNKYGSTSKLYGYEYAEGRLAEIWSSDGELQRPIVVQGYDEKLSSLKVTVGQRQKNISFSKEEEQAYLKFTKALEVKYPTESLLNLVTTPQFRVDNYGIDGEQELLLETIVGFDACPITKVEYATFRFSNAGIQLIDSRITKVEGLLNPT